MSVKYVKINVDVPTTKIKLTRGMEWPLDSAPEIVRNFAGQGPDKTMHVLGNQAICTIFEKEFPLEGMTEGLGVPDADAMFNDDNDGLDDI